MSLCETTFSYASVLGKLKNKKLRGKSRGERDVLKERLLRRDNSVPDDDTSSTTTDSSAGCEHDDKVNIH